MKLFSPRDTKRVVFASTSLLLLCVSAPGAFFPAFHTSVLADLGTTVAVNPSSVEANPGRYFAINVTITDVTYLHAWGFRLRWPYGLLEIEAENITEGLFLRQGGKTALVKKNYTDYIDVACTILGASTVNGSGTLATVTFRIQTTGNATLDLYNVTLLNSTSEVIGDWECKDSPDDGYLYTTWPVARYSYMPHPTDYPGHPIIGETVTFNATESYDPDDPYDSTSEGIVSYRWDFDDGNVTTVSDPLTTHVYANPGFYRVSLNITDDEGETSAEELTVLIQLHDISVISVAVAPAAVYVGGIVTVNVTVLNEGNVLENFNVTAYYNQSPIETEAGKSLQMGENMTVTLSWNTTGVAGGDYQIWAEATDVEGEGYVEDNKFIDGTVTVKSAGQSLPITIIVGAVVAVAVLAIILLRYMQRSRNTQKEGVSPF